MRGIAEPLRQPQAVSSTSLSEGKNRGRRIRTQLLSRSVVGSPLQALRRTRFRHLAHRHHRQDSVLNLRPRATSQAKLLRSLPRVRIDGACVPGSQIALCPQGQGPLDESSEIEGAPLGEQSELQGVDYAGEDRKLVDETSLEAAVAESLPQRE